MKKNILLRTNIFICVLIATGFALTFFVSHLSNRIHMRRDVENISSLTSEGIYYQIESIFAKPVHTSLTMANDTLLADMLEKEPAQTAEPSYVKSIQDYLSAYQTLYGYDSVFLVSAKTGRYYHYKTGVDRILTGDNAQNDWYYSLLSGSEDYALNIDQDEVHATDGSLTIFVNCKVYSQDGEVLGVAGVGFAVDTLQQIFRDYEDSFHIKAYLVDSDGTVEISTGQAGASRTDLFANSSYEALKASVLSGQENTQTFWFSSPEEKGVLATSYIPTLGWYLIIENDSSSLWEQLNWQLFFGIAATLAVTAGVLLLITRIIRRYNNRIVDLTLEREEARRTALKTITERLYEHIFEIDITHGRAASRDTEDYFESLGLPRDADYQEILQMLTREQVLPEYHQGYLDVFSLENIQSSHEKGVDVLRYEFQITYDGGATSHWIRATALLTFQETDQSLHMLICRQNIDREKKQEVKMAEQIRRDSLTGLYNKGATQELVSRLLAAQPGARYAFFILDVDHFKTINDTCGHAMGDQVIADFSRRLRHLFRKQDIVGRIGGDEFIIFVPAPSADWAERKAKVLTHALQYEFSDGAHRCRVSASIGVALSPDAGTDFETLYKNADTALYQTKRQGRKGYAFFTNAS